VLASHGLTSVEIAQQLVLSAGTVRTHLENIYLKLGVSDKAAAVATALRYGLID
jgi:two-component system nitrate/nitrite response regulator NarL